MVEKVPACLPYAGHTCRLPLSLSNPSFFFLSISTVLQTWYSLEILLKLSPDAHSPSCGTDSRVRTQALSKQGLS